MEHDPPTTELQDQRRAQRVTAEGTVHVRLLTEHLTGECENLSDAGILLHAEEAPRVEVELMGPEGAWRRTGRLVRVHRMDGSRCGLAGEFEPVDEASGPTGGDRAGTGEGER